MENKIVLCLDLGTKTGFAARLSSTTVLSGTKDFKNSRFEGGGMRYLKFRNWLSEIKQGLGQIDLVYFEEVQAHRGTAAAHAYGGFMNHLTAWCEENKIPYDGVPVGTIKKHATGKGNAGKNEMIEAVKQHGHSPTDDNEADALALLYWAYDEGVTA